MDASLESMVARARRDDTRAGPARPPRSRTAPRASPRRSRASHRVLTSSMPTIGAAPGGITRTGSAMNAVPETRSSSPRKYANRCLCSERPCRARSTPDFAQMPPGADDHARRRRRCSSASSGGSHRAARRRARRARACWASRGGSSRRSRASPPSLSRGVDDRTAGADGDAERFLADDVQTLLAARALRSGDGSVGSVDDVQRPDGAARDQQLVVARTPPGAAPMQLPRRSRRRLSLRLHAGRTRAAIETPRRVHAAERRVGAQVPAAHASAPDKPIVDHAVS